MRRRRTSSSAVRAAHADVRLPVRRPPRARAQRQPAGLSCGAPGTRWSSPTCGRASTTGSPLYPQLTPAQLELSRLMVRYWGAFARSGVPSVHGQPLWPRYSERPLDVAAARATARWRSATPSSPPSTTARSGTRCRRPVKRSLVRLAIRSRIPVSSLMRDSQGVVGVELDHRIAAGRPDIRLCSAGGIARSWRQMMYARGSATNASRGSPYRHGLRERRDRLRPAPGDALCGVLVARAAVQHLARRGVGHRRDRRVAVDDEVGLHLIVGGLRERGQVEQALAVGRRERGHVDQCLDLLGRCSRRPASRPPRPCCGRRAPPADPSAEHLAHALRVGVERDLGDRRLVLARAGQVERLHRVARLRRPGITGSQHHAPLNAPCTSTILAISISPIRLSVRPCRAGRRARTRR